MLQLPLASRTSLEELLALRVRSGDANALPEPGTVSGTSPLVPLRELVKSRPTIVDKSIYHKNLMPVTYVIGDVAGVVESPVYAILNMNRELAESGCAAIWRERREAAHFAMPFSHSRTTSRPSSGMANGTSPIEVFRDLGTAFAAVLVLIYVLVVGWFRSFKTPFIVMAAIPFSLVGILPAHGLMGAFFTATSMIGFMAGAGIVVRNSIILVDFIELRLAEGHAAGGGGGGCRGGALSADAADGARGGGRRGGDPLRPDLPRAGDFLDGGRNRITAAQPHGGAGAVFHDAQPRGGVGVRFGGLTAKKDLVSIWVVNQAIAA